MWQVGVSRPCGVCKHARKASHYGSCSKFEDLMHPKLELGVMVLCQSR